MSVFNDYSTKSIYNHLKTIKNYHSDIENLQIIVVIDYLQVIEHDYKDNREGLNRACKELKNIQKSFNCMLIALSQLSNEGNYRETSEIRNISDIIIKLYNEKEYLEREKKKSVDYDTSMNFIFSIEKNKAGQKGMIYKAKINSNFNFYDFQDSNNLEVNFINTNKSIIKNSSNATEIDLSPRPAKSI